MTDENQEYFYTTYPTIFKQKDLPMTHTAMCWGLECNDGWKNHIDTLCKKLVLIEKVSSVSTEATQIKEKYAGLRFYFQNTINDELMSDEDRSLWTDIIQDVVSESEGQSQYVCEICGEYGWVRTSGHWIKTLCNEHRDELGYKDLDPK
jgi:hypothetical protein